MHPCTPAESLRVGACRSPQVDVETLHSGGYEQTCAALGASRRATTWGGNSLRPYPVLRLSSSLGNRFPGDQVNSERRLRG